MPDNPRDKTRDDQVIALLNKLGEQLIRSEKERLTLGVKLARLEQQQQGQAQKLAQTESLNQRIEDAITQQNRMNRRLEQVTQDKVRITRKLDRIEEAVIETREALQSKALVLLTDQAVANSSGRAQVPADPSKTSPARKALRAWWEKPLSLQTAAVAAIILMAGLGGWAVLRLATNNSHDMTTVFAAATPASSTDTAPVFTTASVPVQSITASPDNTAAAQQMNTIAPAAGPVPENLEKAASSAAASAPVKPASFTPQDTTAEPDIETFIAQQRDSHPLADRAKPDPSLPPMVRQIEKKAFEGVPEAQHDLAAVYTAGHAGVTPNYKKAAFWFQEAAINGVANARYNLGVLYQQGMGVDKNLDKAIGWYRAAAKLGHPEAEYNLGISYIEGVGMSYNPQKATHFFEQAANGGVVEAAYNLGLIYENGLLGSPDHTEALYWYKRAADRGSKEGQTALNQLAKTMKLDQAGIEKTVKDMHPEAGAQPAEAVGKTAAVAPQKTKPVPADHKSPPPAPKQTAAAAQSDGEDSADAAANTPAATTPSPSDSAAVQSNALLSQIEEQLIKRGLYPGPADGLNGPLVEDAIRAYQSANNLTPDGRATQALLVNMLSGNMEKAGGHTQNTASNSPSTLRPEDLAEPQ